MRSKYTAMRVHHEAGSEEDSVGIFGMMSCFSSNDSNSPDWCTAEGLVHTIVFRINFFKKTHFQGGYRTHQQTPR